MEYIRNNDLGKMLRADANRDEVAGGGLLTPFMVTLGVIVLAVGGFTLLNALAESHVAPAFPLED